jgi:hypothetical protein
MSVYPAAPQICDGINNDCNDPQWPDVPVNESEIDNDTHLLCDDDCDDMIASIFTGARSESMKQAPLRLAFEG